MDIDFDKDENFEEKDVDIKTDSQDDQSFVHFELVDGIPVLVDGEQFSSELLLQSLKEIGPKVKLYGVQLGDFIKKVCGAFGLSTDVVYETIQDVTDAAENVVKGESELPNTSEERRFVPVGSVEESNSDEDFELNDLSDDDKVM